MFAMILAGTCIHDINIYTQFKTKQQHLKNEKNNHFEKKIIGIVGNLINLLLAEIFVVVCQTIIIQTIFYLFLRLQYSYIISTFS